MALGDAISGIIDKGVESGLEFGESWIKDMLGIGGTPLERLKANVGGYAKTARFAVLITPPAAMKTRSGTEMDNISLACTAVSGLMYSLGTHDVRQGEMIPLKLPNDEIFPDIVTSFNNTIIFGKLNALTFFEEWLALIKDRDGFGFYDDYVGHMLIQQYDDRGNNIKEYKITDYYPHTIVPDAFTQAAENTIQTFQILGTWF